MVISTQSMPPSRTASTAAKALLLSGVRIIGTTASSLIRARISACFTRNVLSRLEFFRQLEIESYLGAAVKDANRLVFAREPSGHGAKLVVNVVAQAPELILAVLLGDVGANLQGFRVFDLNDGAGHRRAIRAENRSFDSAARRTA